ncbi:hypothetical protein AURDEDRAFT_188720 [Auricularia subglabra TFB-10046 SS5]|uniref:MYND-type domain-containing protein n=1 Tax=Auricularia subglabra (strain TFB-10046 / SS5) TaxID=717982 RepID=J0D8F2_AURST|nr:hypothetical protein AURDEDRAFT_188720 [Auricularia subglabra TFB-10046 SS5]
MSQKMWHFFKSSMASGNLGFMVFMKSVKKNGQMEGDREWANFAANVSAVPSSTSSGDIRSIPPISAQPVFRKSAPQTPPARLLAATSLDFLSPPRHWDLVPVRLRAFEMVSRSVQIADFVAAAFADPFLPTLCPFCFMAFAHEIKSPEQIGLIQTKCHAVWTVLAAFISAEWTTAREETVTACLEHAAVSCPEHSSCDLDMPIGNTFFGRVYTFASAYIHKALTESKHRYKGFGRTASRWPFATEQLFPYGPERTVRSLVAQLPRFSSVHVVLHDVLKFHRPLILPVLLLPDLRAQMRAALLSRLTTCTSLVNDGLAEFGPPVSHVLRRTTMQEPLMACLGVTWLLLAVVRGRGARPDDKARFSLGRETELFKALDVFLTLVGDCDEYAGMGYLAGYLWLPMSPSQRRSVGYPQPPPYASNIEAGKDLDDPYRALRFHLRSRPRQRACSRPGCTTADPRLAQCGKCHVASYCSRDCQRADWKDELLPHKAVCDALQELRTFTPLDSPEMTPNEFAAACAEHEFPLERVDLLIKWATQGKIATHYALGGESFSDLMKPLDDLDRMRARNPSANESGSKNVLLKISDGIEVMLTLPESEAIMSEREFYQELTGFKEMMEAGGQPVSWRVC